MLPKKRYLPFSLMIILLLFISLGEGYGADSPAVLLSRGLDKFRAGDYQRALSDFQALAAMKEDNPYADAGIYMTARTLVRMKQYGEAMGEVIRLRTEHASSGYIDDALFLEAEIKYVQSRDKEAAERLLALLNERTDPALKRQAEDRLKLILKGYSAAVLTNLRESAPAEARGFINRMIDESTKHSKIIILASPEDSAAPEIVEGMKTALRLYHRRQGALSPVMEVKTIQGDLLDIYFFVKSLEDAGAHSIISLYGGEESLMAAAACSRLDAPFFAVMDVHPGIWRMNSNIWQLCPDLESMGSTLADFAVNAMGLKRFVTLAPLDNQRAQFAEAFIKRAKALEAEIAGEEWYYSEAMNLADNFRSLRRTGFRKAFDDSLTALMDKDSLILKADAVQGMEAKFLKDIGNDLFQITALSDSALDILWANHLEFIMERARFQRSQVDSNSIRLHCYDGFVFPLSLDEVDMYIPQFAFYNFDTHLFCLESAFTPEKLGNLSDHLKNLILTGWGPPSGMGNASSQSLSDFIAAKGSAPSALEALGFDVMDFTLNCSELYKISEGVPNEKIERRGLRYDFIFPQGQRNNQSISFYRFTGAGYIPLAETILDDAKSASAPGGKE